MVAITFRPMSMMTPVASLTFSIIFLDESMNAIAPRRGIHTFIQEGQSIDFACVKSTSKARIHAIHAPGACILAEASVAGRPSGPVWPHSVRTRKASTVNCDLKGTGSTLSLAEFLYSDVAKIVAEEQAEIWSFLQNGGGGERFGKKCLEALGKELRAQEGTQQQRQHQQHNLAQTFAEYCMDGIVDDGEGNGFLASEVGFAIEQAIEQNSLAAMRGKGKFYDDFSEKMKNSIDSEPEESISTSSSPTSLRGTTSSFILCPYSTRYNVLTVPWDYSLYKNRMWLVFNTGGQQRLSLEVLMGLGVIGGGEGRDGGRGRHGGRVGGRDGRRDGGRDLTGGTDPTGGRHTSRVFTGGRSSTGRALSGDTSKTRERDLTRQRSRAISSPNRLPHSQISPLPPITLPRSFQLSKPYDRNFFSASESEAFGLSTSYTQALGLFRRYTLEMEMTEELSSEVTVEDVFAATVKGANMRGVVLVGGNIVGGNKNIRGAESDIAKVRDGESSRLETANENNLPNENLPHEVEGLSLSAEDYAKKKFAAWQKQLKKFQREKNRLPDYEEVSRLNLGFYEWADRYGKSRLMRYPDATRHPFYDSEAGRRNRKTYESVESIENEKTLTSGEGDQEGLLHSAERGVLHPAERVSGMRYLRGEGKDIYGERDLAGSTLANINYGMNHGMNHDYQWGRSSGMYTQHEKTKLCTWGSCEENDVYDPFYAHVNSTTMMRSTLMMLSEVGDVIGGCEWQDAVRKAWERARRDTVFRGEQRGENTLSHTKSGEKQKTVHPIPTQSQAQKTQTQTQNIHTQTTHTQKTHTQKTQTRLQSFHSNVQTILKNSLSHTHAAHMDYSASYWLLELLQFLADMRKLYRDSIAGRADPRAWDIMMVQGVLDVDFHRNKAHSAFVTANGNDLAANGISEQYEGPDSKGIMYLKTSSSNVPYEAEFSEEIEYEGKMYLKNTKVPNSSALFPRHKNMSTATQTFDLTKICPNAIQPIQQNSDMQYQQNSVQQKQIDVGPRCWRRAWIAVGCRAETVPMYEEWHATQTIEQLIFDAFEWSTLEDEGHRRVCYGEGYKEGNGREGEKDSNDDNETGAHDDTDTKNYADESEDDFFLEDTTSDEKNKNTTTHTTTQEENEVSKSTAHHNTAYNHLHGGDDNQSTTQSSIRSTESSPQSTHHPLLPRRHSYKEREIRKRLQGEFFEGRQESIPAIQKLYMAMRKLALAKLPVFLDGVSSFSSNNHDGGGDTGADIASLSFGFDTAWDIASSSAYIPASSAEYGAGSGAESYAAGYGFSVISDSFRFRIPRHLFRGLDVEGKGKNLRQFVQIRRSEPESSDGKDGTAASDGKDGKGKDVKEGVKFYIDRVAAEDVEHEQPGFSFPRVVQQGVEKVPTSISTSLMPALLRKAFFAKRLFSYESVRAGFIETVSISKNTFRSITSPLLEKVILLARLLSNEWIWEEVVLKSTQDTQDVGDDTQDSSTHNGQGRIHNTGIPGGEGDENDNVEIGKAFTNIVKSHFVDIGQDDAWNGISFFTLIQEDWQMLP